MKVDPLLMPKPRPKPPERERWRDAGDGMIECEITKRKVPLLHARSVPMHGGRSMSFTDAEWTKLEALAAARSTRKHTYTPEECVRAFVASCQPGGSGWKVPGS